MLDLEIIVPVKNEAGNLINLVRRIHEALTPAKIAYGIIVIDDHSTDSTLQVLENLSKKYPIKFYLKKGAIGKAYSVLEGASYAQAENLAMLDGDLQYDPEVIPQMFERLTESGVVVGNRHYQDKSLRRFTSKGFKLVFGKLLFGFDVDIQSGLKLFKKDIITRINKSEVSPWTIDLPLLSTAKELGYAISQVDINFYPRIFGKTKVNLIHSSAELAISSLKLKFADKPINQLGPQSQDSMLEAGVIYRKKKFITHTTLDHSLSAITTFIGWQKILVILVSLGLILGLFLNLLLAIQAVVLVLSAVYFIDAVFSFFIVHRSIKDPPEISFSKDEILKINEDKLPIYSILCPLYKETSVLPNFLKSISKLDWPKNKLDVQLLLEEDDKETIEAARSLNLPEYISLAIVPNSQPKTKPKACNFGLAKTKGEYLVVYDAEDNPDPYQLKKAYLAYQSLPENIVCLQAKLNYYNHKQNLLTRLFTTEYSLWFDVILPGLQSINAVIPLGGTSNHFKTAILKTIGGWDPFNVAEDCDLGVRLFSQGFKTAIIDSTTLEEANSQVKNWLRQRSRWIKGYMQTYLVHTRKPFKFLKEKGIHALIFQLVVGARISFLLINPVLWLAIISYFTLYPIVGPAIESFYTGPAFYMAISAFVFGNFLYLYSYMIGCAKRGQWELIKYVFLVPFYWLLASFSAVIAIYQLLVKPHYWEKTIHGFHLNTNKVKESFFSTIFRKYWAIIESQKKLFAGGALLVVASIIANFLNFAFNSYLGRILKFQDFALIGLMGGFLSLASIFFGAFSTTANFRSGYLIGKYGNDAGFIFWKYLRRRTFRFSLILTLLWFASVPFLMKFFGTGNPFVFIFFGAILVVGFASSTDRGFLSARLMFGSLAVMYFLDPVIKLLTALILVYFKFKLWAFSAIPLSMLGTFIIGWLLIVKQVKLNSYILPKFEIHNFPKKFFATSIFSGFSPIAFLTIDILLANHFLAPVETGQYTLLSLVGKMVYFFGSLTGSFLIPFLSRNEGAKTPSKAFNIVLLSTVFLSGIAFLVFGLFSHITIPLLYGKKALAITPFLAFFTAAVASYTIARVFINYYLVKKVYSFTILGILLTGLQILLISLYHQSPKAIAIDMSIVGGSYLVLTGLLHLRVNQVQAFEDNLKVFLRLFIKPETKKKKKLSILVFNWRDIKHKWAGGAEVYIHELARRWVQEGHKVTLFCGNGSDRPHVEKIDGVQIYRKGNFYTAYIWAFLYYLFKFRGKYNVIVDSENGIPFFTPLYAKERKVLVIHHVHQEIFRKNLIKPLAMLASFLEMRLMPYVYRNVQTITVSPSTKDEILKNKLSQVEPTIIYNGLDTEKFVPGKKYKVPLFAYIGRLQNYKSLHILIKAAKKVLQVIPNAEFVIAGDGQARKELEGMAKELNIDNKVYFTGKVTEEEKISLYQKAWGFVNPSFMEGWGITTIEANSCGTPALASNVPGLRDSVKNPHTGFLFPYADSDRLSEIMVELTKNTKLRKELSKNAIEWAHNFSWDKSAQESLALIKKPYES